MIMNAKRLILFERLIAKKTKKESSDIGPSSFSMQISGYKSSPSSLAPAGAHAQVPPGAKPALTDQASGTNALLQAVSAVSDRIVWVSGHGATFARTTDGGEHWQAGTVPGDNRIQFRDPVSRRAGCVAH